MEGRLTREPGQRPCGSDERAIDLQRRSIRELCPQLGAFERWAGELQDWADISNRQVDSVALLDPVRNQFAELVVGKTANQKECDQQHARAGNPDDNQRARQRFAGLVVGGCGHARSARR